MERGCSTAQLLAQLDGFKGQGLMSRVQGLECKGGGACVGCSGNSKPYLLNLSVAPGGKQIHYQPQSICTCSSYSSLPTHSNHPTYVDPTAFRFIYFLRALTFDTSHADEFRHQHPSSFLIMTGWQD